MSQITDVSDENKVESTSSSSHNRVGQSSSTRCLKLIYIIEPSLTKLDELTTCIQNISQEHVVEPSDRALVFVTMIMNGELLAGSLGCEFYCTDTSVYVSKSNQQLMDEGVVNSFPAD